MGELSQRRTLIVKICDPPDHPGLRTEHQERIQPAALRYGRRQEDRRRHLLDQNVRFLVQIPNRVFNLAAIDRLAFVKLNLLVSGQPLAQDA